MRQKVILGGLTALAVAAAGAVVVWACGGTPVPTCATTVTLSTWAPCTVVHPGPGEPILFPVGVLPFAQWTPGAPCPQPFSAELILELTLTPIAGGAPTTVGPLTISTDVPLVPGAQSVPQTLGGALVPGGPFQFPIPLDLVPQGTYDVAIDGSYSVTFGQGNTPLLNAAPTVLSPGCIGEPAPGNPDLPRFNMKLIDLTGQGYGTCAPGDQAVFCYLLENNDPFESLSVVLSSTTEQVARQPRGDDPFTQFAISNPTPRTDSFPQGLPDDLVSPPPLLLPLPDPTVQGSQLVSQAITLAPGEVTIQRIAVRSHGMCANGSCSKQMVIAQGAFLDSGDQAKAAAGTSYLVGDVAPKSPLFVYTDDFDTGPRQPQNDSFEGEIGEAVFNQDHALSTQTPGNIPAEDSTLGPNFFAKADFVTQFADAVSVAELGLDQPTAAFSALRTEFQADVVETTWTAFPGAVGFGLQVNCVRLFNLPVGQPVTLPFFLTPQFGQDALFTIIYDGATDELLLFDSLLPPGPPSVNPVFNSPLSLLPQSTAFYQLDGGATRTFTCDSTAVDLPGVEADPPTAVPADFFVPDPESFRTDTVVQRLHEVRDPETQAPQPWTATAQVPIEMVALSLVGVDPIPGPTATGGPGQDLILRVDLALVPPPRIRDQTVIGFEPSQVGIVEVVSPGTYNGSTKIPVALRNTEIPKVVVGNYTAKIKRNFKKTPKDKATVKTVLPTGPGVVLEGKLVVVEFGGQKFPFVLDKKGKGIPTDEATPDVRSLKIKIDKKTGNLKVTFKVKKGSFTYLDDDGINNADVPGVVAKKPKGDPRTVPFQVGICDVNYCVDLELDYKAKLDKKGSAKGKVKFVK